MEAEKAKWRHIYYSTLKEKEKVVTEEQEESLEDTELESDDDEESLEVTELESKPMMEPQLPPSQLPTPPLSPPVLLTPPPSSDNEELSLEAVEPESEPNTTTQLPSSLLTTQPTPSPSFPSPPPLEQELLKEGTMGFTLNPKELHKKRNMPPLVSPPSTPPRPQPSSPPSLGSKYGSGATILNTRGVNRYDRKMEVHMFDSYRPPPPMPPPPLSGIQSMRKGTIDSMLD